MAAEERREEEAEEEEACACDATGAIELMPAYKLKLVYPRREATAEAVVRCSIITGKCTRPLRLTSDATRPQARSQTRRCVR